MTVLNHKDEMMRKIITALAYGLASWVVGLIFSYEQTSLILTGWPISQWLLDGPAKGLDYGLKLTILLTTVLVSLTLWGALAYYFEGLIKKGLGELPQSPTPLSCPKGFAKALAMWMLLMISWSLHYEISPKSEWADFQGVVTLTLLALTPWLWVNLLPVIQRLSRSVKKEEVAARSVLEKESTNPPLKPVLWKAGFIILLLVGSVTLDEKIVTPVVRDPVMESLMHLKYTLNKNRREPELQDIEWGEVLKGKDPMTALIEKVVREENERLSQGQLNSSATSSARLEWVKEEGERHNRLMREVAIKVTNVDEPLCQALLTQFEKEALLEVSNEEDYSFSELLELPIQYRRSHWVDRRNPRDQMNNPWFAKVKVSSLDENGERVETIRNRASDWVDPETAVKCNAKHKDIEVTFME